jgi:hypothetical protein
LVEPPRGRSPCLAERRRLLRISRLGFFERAFELGNATFAAIDCLPLLAHPCQ